MRWSATFVFVGLVCTLAVLGWTDAVEAAEPIPPADKLVYDPISTEARKLGRLDKYDAIETQSVKVSLGALTLQAKVPVRAEAYDPVPISYQLIGEPGANDRVAVEAVAFEPASQRQGRHLYDLALPGAMGVKVEYLGSQTGVYDLDRVKRLTPTSRHDTFPPYVLEPFVRSGTVKRGNYLFFKFRITNTGDTILDAEGFGGFMAIPQAFLITEDGREVLKGHTINQYKRHLEYLYPGESYEDWVCFMTPHDNVIEVARTLRTGKFIIKYMLAYRWNADYDWAINMWAGKPWYCLEVPIEVKEHAEQTPVGPVREVDMEPTPAEKDRLTRYVRSLEEFMTSFKVYEKAELAAPVKDRLYIQVAPWTKHIVLKVIGNKPGQIHTLAVPIAVATTNLAMTHNPDNPFVVEQDGQVVPAFNTQSMVAMRATTQLGPHPERHIPVRAAEKVECGVNTLCTTSGDWQQREIWDDQAFVGDVHAETWKYYYDVVVPELGLPVFGWGLFPNKTENVIGTGGVYWGEEFDIPFTGEDFTYSGHKELDVAHPDFPKAYAGTILFNYERWGDFWYRTAEGDVIIDVEDSWGWLRDDINVRYYLGQYALDRFHQWLKDRYSTIEAVNNAWGTDYAAFESIDPQANQGNEGIIHGRDLSRLGPVYNNPDNPFHDWTPAVNDWDVFRTELRCDVYEQILKYVRQKIPTAQINIRTEGALIPVSVPEDSPNSHLRHIYHVQRRQALIAEILEKRKVFKYHSDYTTLPYTETEWRMLLTKLREQGMRGNYLPQFCTMRDMVVSEHYGRDFTANYGYDEPRLAIMVHRLQAAYPVWRIMYEEGHCPGVIWEDYMCDGFVTETQKRELRIFREHLDALARTP